MVIKVQWLCWKGICNLREQGGLSWTLPHQIYTTLGLRISVKFTKPSYETLPFETNIHRLDWVAQVIIIRVTPILQNLSICSQEETEWQEQGAREAAWRLAESLSKIKGNGKEAFFSFQGRCLLAHSHMSSNSETSEREDQCGIDSSSRTCVMWSCWTERTGRLVDQTNQKNQNQIKTKTPIWSGEICVIPS